MEPRVDDRRRHPARLLNAVDELRVVRVEQGVRRRSDTEHFVRVRRHLANGARRHLLQQVSFTPDARNNLKVRKGYHGLGAVLIKYPPAPVNL